MADDTSNKPYPFQFDPSQWTNPYSNFYGKALPWPSSYAGTPTNALGQPIQPPQGMTLNQTPQQPQAPAAAAPQVSPGAGYFQGAAGSQALGAQLAPAGSAPGIQALWGRNFAGGAPPAGSPLAAGSIYGSPLLYGPASAVNPNSGLTPQRGNVQTGPNQYMSQQGYQTLYGGGQQPQQQAAAPPGAAPPNNWQNTLSMLANPGHVTTPGATVPQAAPGGGQPSPGVLQNFLANWKPAQSGPGAGFTQNFNTILRGLQGG